MRKETANDVGILQIVMCEDCGEPSMQLLVAFFAGVEQSGAFALDDGAEPIGAIRGPDAELEGDDGLAARGAQLSTGDPLAETMLAAGYTLAHDLATAAIHVDRALTLDDRIFSQRHTVKFHRTSRAPLGLSLAGRRIARTRADRYRARLERSTVHPAA